MTSSTTALWGARYGRLTIGLLLTIVGPAFEALAVATTLPATVRELGGLELYGWAFSAFMLANLVGGAVAGGEADRLGPRIPLIIGSVLFTIGLLLAGFAPTMPLLIVGRTVQGLGAGIIGAIIYVIIGRGFPAEMKPRLLALVSTAWVVPGLIGPALAGLIADTFGWRLVFLAIVPLALIAMALTLPALGDMQGDPGRARDMRRIVDAVRIAGGVALALAIPQLVGAFWSSSFARADLSAFAASIGPSVLSLLALAVPALIAIPALRRLLPPGTLQAAPGPAAAVAAHGLLTMAFFGADAYVPLAITEVLRQPSAVGGLALTGATLGWTTGAWVQERLAATRSRRLVATSGMVLVALTIALFGAGVALSLPAPLIIAIWTFSGLGIGLAFTTFTLSTLEHADPAEQGAASSALQIANSIGSAVGPGVGGIFIGTAVSSTPDPGAIVAHCVLMTCVALLGLAAARRIPRRPPATAG